MATTPKTPPVYNLNPESAKQVGVSSFITEKGAYVGEFTRAEAVVSEQGTHGIELSFRSDTGQTAEYLTIWTVNSEGRETYGRKVLDAIMTALRLRSLEPSAGKVMKWNRTAGREEMTQATLYQSLMGKKIGLLMIAEEYAKTDGSGTGWKMVIVATFDSDTNQTPREILEKKPATALTDMVEALRDKPLKKRRASAGHGGGAGGGYEPGADHDEPIGDNWF